MALELRRAPTEALSENLAAAVRRAVGHLAAGGVVIGPTESSYGLFASAFSAKACARVAELKLRPDDQPLPLVVADAEQLARVISRAPTEHELKVMQHFWPGPLTLIFPAHADIPVAVHVGTKSVGVRIVPHPVAAALCHAAGPLTATSANRSGRPAACRAEDIDERLLAEDVLVIDAGPTPADARPSTLARVLQFGEVVVLREGPITLNQLQTVIRGR